MVNIPFFKQLLEFNQDILISHEDVITIELSTFLKNYRQSDYVRLFDKVDPKLKIKPKYEVEVTCDNCKCVSTKKMTKTKLFEWLRRSKIECHTCKNLARKLAMERIEKEEQEKADKTIAKNTAIVDKLKWFCETFLNPKHSWVKQTPVRTQISTLQEKIIGLNCDVLAEHIKLIPYEDFLKTPYWKAIASDVRQRSGYKCVICSAEKPLQAHHNTYKNRGYELQCRTTDLIALCSDCHSTFHKERELA